MSSPYRYILIPWWYDTEGMKTLPDKHVDVVLLAIIAFVSQATTIDNGMMSDILSTSGLKSTLSCLAGARLIFMVQMTCFRTSAPNDSLTYFLLNSALSV